MCKGGLDKTSSRSVFVGGEDIGEFDFGLSRRRWKMLLFGFWEDIGGGVGGEKISLVDLNGVSPSFVSVFVFLVDRLDGI